MKSVSIGGSISCVMANISDGKKRWLSSAMLPDVPDRRIGLRVNIPKGRMTTQSPFLRAGNIGFRCVKYIEPDSIPKEALAAMPSPRRDLTKEKPVSDQIFQAYRGLYSYDKTPLNASVEQVDSKEEDWRIEKITYSVKELVGVIGV